MEIVRGRLSASDVTPTNLRYNADCDCVQYSPDGGTTWNADPSSDPRHSLALLKPPLTTGDIRCDAAANMVKWLRDFIEYEASILTTGATIVGVANAGLALFDLLSPFAILASLIIDLAGTLFTIGGTALTAAFGDTEYGLLLCIFRCNIDASGRANPAALARIESQITEQLNTTAALITNLILSVQGETGLSNAGAIGSETGDCSDCDCDWCYTFYFDDGDGGWALRSAGEGLYTGASWIAIYSAADAGKVVVIERAIPSGTVIKSLSPNFSYVQGSTGGCPAGETRGAFLRYLNSGGDYINFTSSELPLPTGDYPNTIQLVATNTPAKVQVNIWSAECDHTDGAVTIHSVTLRGEGENPFGDDNC